MWILKLFIFNIHFLSPLSQALKDFELTDLLYSKLRGEIAKTDTSIVLVNIGNNSRDEIARQIQALNRYKPAVLAIDVVFAEKKSEFGDSMLRQALAASQNVVPAVYFEYSDSAQHGAFDRLVVSHPSIISSKEAGFVNFISEGKETTVRHYAPLMEFEGKSYEAFAAVIARKYDPRAYERLNQRKLPYEIIHYSSTQEQYVCIDATEVYDSNPSLDVVRNKIVIMGFMGPDLNTPVLEDRHFTPMNHRYSGRSFPDMYGPVIHANIASAILSGNYVNELPTWVLLLISFVICYLHMVFFVHYYVHRHIWFHLFFKVVQVLTSVIIVGIALFIYAEAKLKIETGLILVPVILSVDLLYFYDAIVKALNKRYGYKTVFVNHHHHEQH